MVRFETAFLIEICYMSGQISHEFDIAEFEIQSSPISKPHPADRDPHKTPNNSGSYINEAV